MHSAAKYVNSAIDSDKDLVKNLLDKMVWSTNEKVLDFGCGPGNRDYQSILPQIEQFDSHLYAVDISQSMIDYATEHFSHEKITYACGDILGTKFPFREMQFDKIVSIYVLHWINDVKIALKNLNDITKVGGQAGFIFATSNCFNHQAVPILAQSETWGPFMKGYENFTISWSKFKEGEEHMGFTNLFESCGWKVQQLEILKSYITKPMDEFIDFCMSVSPFLGKIPESKYPELKQDLRSIITKIAKIPLDSTHVDAYFESVMINVTK